MKILKKPLVKIGISILLITVLLLNVDRDSIINNLKLLNFAYAPLIILLIVLNYVISSIRWKYLVNIYDGSEKASLKYLVNLYFIGSFFNNFMPTSVGGDVYKIVKLGNRIGSKAHAFSATFMERFTGVIALVFIAAIGFVFTIFRGFAGFEQNVLLLGGVVVGLMIAFGVGIVIALRLLEKLQKKSIKLEKLYNSLICYKGQNKVLAIALISSFLVQLCAIFTQFYILASLGSHIDVFKACFIFPIIILASFFIPSLNGIGVQDFLYKFSNGFLVIAEPTAIAASILYHLFRLIVSLFGGILYAAGKSD